MKSEKQLYQWDIKQYLAELQPTAEFVDYPMGNDVIRIETDGKRCRIPDEFLQTAGFKTCYERYSDGTYKAYSFNVQSSPKPPDYVYTAEFDANAAALQTEVDRLRGECDTLAAENRKQENKISALIKLNKGQTYDILPEEGETASRTAPSGAKYVSVDKVGGKSVVWNQLWNYGETGKEDGVTFTYENNFYDVVKNTTANNGLLVYYNVKQNNKYYLSFEASSSDNIMLTLSLGRALIAKLTENNARYSTIITTYTIMPVPRAAIYLYSQSGVNCSYRVGNIKVIDLSAMFGVGNEPTAEEFEQMFPAEFYPYNPGKIISSRTETITAGAESITTGFPELHSAGIAHDEIDMDGGQSIRNVYTVELETLQWQKNADSRFVALLPLKAKASGTFNDRNNELCNTYESKTLNELFAGVKGISTHPKTGEKVFIFDDTYDTVEQFVTSLSGAVLQYELATPTTEPVTIPEALQEWLPVEAGGTITFRNADESKQLAVPNGVSWVRKLNEVN